MWTLNTSTFILSILVVYECNLPYGTLYLHRDFTGIRGNLNAMKHSIELCLLYGQKTFMNSVQL